MRFVPTKQKLLVEAEVNPLEANTVDLTFDEQYTQAILKAIASETAAHVEYSQIIAIEPKVSQKWLVEHFHDTLVDISDEEMRHLGQLTAKVSEIPELKDAFEAGVEEANSGKDTSDDDSTNADNEDDSKKEGDKDEKEEVKESVDDTRQLLTEALDPNRTYSADSVIEVLDNMFGLSDEQLDVVMHWIDSSMDEIDASYLDMCLGNILTGIGADLERLPEVEDAIIASRNPMADRQLEFENDIHIDVSIIEDTIERVTTLAAKEALGELITKLRAMEYDGDRDTGWNSSHAMLGGSNPTKRVIV